MSVCERIAREATEFLLVISVSYLLFRRRICSYKSTTLIALAVTKYVICYDACALICLYSLSAHVIFFFYDAPLFPFFFGGGGIVVLL